MTVEMRTKRFPICKCGMEYSSFEHLVEPGKERTFGPWKCESRGCNQQLRGTVKSDGEVVLELSDAPIEKRGWSLLFFRGLWMLYESSFFRPEGDDYFFHSHQCPTNIMGSIKEVYCPEEGEDPHGLFRHVASIEDTLEVRQSLGIDPLPRRPGLPANASECANPSLAEVFRLFKTDGQPPPSQWPEENRGALPFIAELRRSVRAKRSSKATYLSDPSSPSSSPPGSEDPPLGS